MNQQERLGRLEQEEQQEQQGQQEHLEHLEHLGQQNHCQEEVSDVNNIKQLPYNTLSDQKASQGLRFNQILS